jgi:hypothetical protein
VWSSCSGRMSVSTPTARPRSRRRGWPAPGAGNATPALSAGSSTYPYPAIVLDEAAGREGRGQAHLAQTPARDGGEQIEQLHAGRAQAAPAPQLAPEPLASQRTRRLRGRDGPHCSSRVPSDRCRPERRAARLPRWRPRDLPPVVGLERDRVRRADRIREARARARRPGRPGGRHRRPGDCALPRPRPARGRSTRSTCAIVSAPIRTPSRAIGW